MRRAFSGTEYDVAYFVSVLFARAHLTEEKHEQRGARGYLIERVEA